MTPTASSSTPPTASHLAFPACSRGPAARPGGVGPCEAESTGVGRDARWAVAAAPSVARRGNRRSACAAASRARCIKPVLRRPRPLSPCCPTPHPPALPVHGSRPDIGASVHASRTHAARCFSGWAGLPVLAEPGPVVPGRAGPCRSVPFRAGPGRAGPRRAGMGRAHPGRVKTHHARQGRDRPGRGASDSFGGCLGCAAGALGGGGGGRRRRRRGRGRGRGRGGGGAGALGSWLGGSRCMSSASSSESAA